jgi:hypothetical protein
MVVERFKPGLRSVILTGSLARGEATAVVKDGVWEFLADAEFLLLFHDGFPLPSEADVTSIGRRIKAGLQKKSVRCRIGLSACHAKYLANLRPHLFAYELREYGRIVWGDRSVLKLISGFLTSDIPLEDGWRLQCNRMVEHLEEIASLDSIPPQIRGELFYSTLKLCLDSATSLLLFAGAYEPSYRRRAKRLKELARDQTEIHRLSLPFALQEFSDFLSFCTDLKLSPDSASWGTAPWEFWEAGVRYAALVGNWELARLTGVSTPSSSEELMARWIKSQSLIHNLFAWCSLLRRAPWHKQLLHWPRWAWQALHASPRYQIYALAIALFDRLPAILKRESEGVLADNERLYRCLHLPLVPGRKDLKGWRRLASEIGWNYHQFLENTRA